ncbi:MAG: four-carbon acid sugar kinase family protein [Burkholderiales bacterium]|nr:four-carbon acid sugar kinase family protein [Burkholderiales bacterium]
MTRLHLGCIADDFTGATDLANNLVRAGMRVVQTIGVPAETPTAEVDAVVIALKSRTIPASEAVAQSLAALTWLRRHGARQIYFKYCSTFDSTPAGNIGPVTEALLDALHDHPGGRFTIATPAFPDNGRTVFHGHLFVGDRLLSESGMQNHPLTPMRDPDLVRVLQAQSRGQVGLVDYRVVAQGPEAIRARFAALQAAGIRVAIVDAIDNEDLLRLGPALAGLPLVTGGSGIAIGLPANFGLAPSPAASALPAASGRRAIVAGSCSRATGRQVQAFVQAGGAAFRIDPFAIAKGERVVDAALAWYDRQTGSEPALVYSTAEPDSVARAQAQLGVAAAGTLIEGALARIAQGVVARGVRQLVVAGGETAGACVQALGVTQLQIGPQIDPGVPWCYARTGGEGGVYVHLALKSGNFGADDFFAKAFRMLS